MSAATLPNNAPGMWVSSDLFAPEAVDARFNRVLFVVLGLLFAVSIVVPFLQFAGLEQGGGDELPDRYAQLLLTDAPEAEEETPEPVVEEEVVEEDEPAEEETAEEEPVEPESEPEPEVAEPEPQQPAPSAVDQARARAEESGISAIRDAFADLRADDSVAAITNPSALLTTAPSASNSSGSTRPSANALTGDATRSSGGIDTSQLSRSTSNTNISQRESTRVSSPVRERGGSPGPRTDDNQSGAQGNNPIGGRSQQEVALAFDRATSSFYAIQRRALRSNPAGAVGKVIVELTIAPSGAVSAVRIISSELNDPEMERKIIARVSLFKFAAKNVSEATFQYPITFEAPS